MHAISSLRSITYSKIDSRANSNSVACMSGVQWGMRQIDFILQPDLIQHTSYVHTHLQREQMEFYSCLIYDLSIIPNANNIRS